MYMLVINMSFSVPDLFNRFEFHIYSHWSTTFGLKFSLIPLCARVEKAIFQIWDRSFRARYPKVANNWQTWLAWPWAGQVWITTIALLYFMGLCSVFCCILISSMKYSIECFKCHFPQKVHFSEIIIALIGLIVNDSLLQDKINLNG